MRYENDEFEVEKQKFNRETFEREQKRLEIEKSKVRLAGLALAILAVVLTFTPSDNNFFIQQKNVAAFLAGMFGFVSIEAIRRSF
jgi:hypothetical protein